jgi:hypothetical protein
MQIAETISFICYFLSAAAAFIFGIMYLTRFDFMPYHREALGKDWGELDNRLQTLIVALMRAVGGGLLGASLAMMIMLFIPFRSGELWAFYTIPAIGLITYLPSLYATMIVRLRTGASSPVIMIATGSALLVVGFAISLFR